VIVEDVRMTSYEKVIKILKNIRGLLIGYNAENFVINDLDWVCNKIQGRDLYNFEIANEVRCEGLSKMTSEFLDLLTNYSDNKEEFNRIAKENHTKFTDSGNIVRREKRLLKNSIKVNKEDREKLASLFAINVGGESPNINVKRVLQKTGITEDILVLNKMNSQVDLDVGSKNFNIFEVCKSLDRSNVLPTIFNDVVRQLKMKELYSIESNKLENFLLKIQAGYNKHVSYHNDLHAADLCQTLFTWINTANVQKVLDLGELDLFSLYFSAIVHDYKHPGYTNAFHMNNLTDLSILYNDKSVLENMHISESFKVLMRADCNFIENFSLTEFKQLRKRMIECVLATDMSHHSKVISQFKTKAQVFEIIKGHNTEKLVRNDSKSYFEDIQEVLNLFIHLGDLSHNTKTFEVSKKWTYLLYEEFFKQGDQEKKLNASISMFCDRETTNIPKSQVGFIKGIVIPSFDVLVNFFPDLDYTVENLEDNLESWEEELEEGS
jgi:hypothetical protein